MTKYISLKSEVKAARGKNKTRLTAQLKEQQVGSLDNEIRVLSRQLDEIKARIVKLLQKRNNLGNM